MPLRYYAPKSARARPVMKTKAATSIHPYRPHAMTPALIHRAENKERNAAIRHGGVSHGDPTSENYIPPYKIVSKFAADFKDEDGRLYYLVTTAHFPDLHKTLLTTMGEINESTVALIVMLPIAITRDANGNKSGYHRQEFPLLANNTLEVTQLNNHKVHQFKVRNTVFAQKKATGLVFVSHI